MTRPSAALVVAEGADPSPGSAPSASLVSVPFQGGALLAAAGSYPEEGDRPVPLAPFCERLGVNVASQVRKLRGKAWTCPVIMTVQIPGDDQARPLVCIPLRALAGWLFTINASKVAPEARAALVAYQREAAEVLYRHFLAPPVPIKVPTVPGTIEATRIEALEARVRKLEAKKGKPAGARVPRAARVAQLVPLVVELVSKQPGIPGATGAATVLRRRRDWVHAATRAALTAGILENRGSEKRPRLYIAGAAQLEGGCA